MASHFPVSFERSTAMQYTLLGVVVCTLCMASTCRTQQKKSKEEQALRIDAQGYLDAMANYRFDDAIPYASQETCESTIPLFHAILASTDSSFLKDYTPATIQIDSVHLYDSTATVFFTKSMPLGTRRQELDMICRAGTWQAHVITQTPEALKHHKPLTNNALQQMKIKKVERRAAADSVSSKQL